MFVVNGVVVNTSDNQDSIRLDSSNGKRFLNYYEKGRLEKRVFVPSHMMGQARQLVEASALVRKYRS